MEYYKLCYVEGNKAWFTNNFEKQWGDDWNDQRPCDMGRYSVEDINKQAVAWIHTDKFNILAGTTYENFIDIIEKNDGRIYLPKEEYKK